MAPRRVAVVTGATGGLGRAIALRLATEGYELGLLGRDHEKTLALGRELRPLTQLITMAGDVGEPATCVILRDLCLETFGHIDLLVCAHGASPKPQAALEVPLSEWEHVQRVDIRGTLLACQILGGPMVERGEGAVVLLSSLHALMTYPERVVYATAKSAVLGLMRALAVEWGPRGISVNAVAPWQVEGERTQGFIDQAAANGVDLRAAYLAKSPLGRLVWPEEVAQTVLFLAQTPAVNGQVLVVDGGVSASMWMHPFGGPNMAVKLPSSP